MPTNYPGALDDYGAAHANGETIEVAHVNDLEDAMEAVQAELGTNPSGASSTVKDRLDSIGGAVVSLSSDASPVVGTTLADAATGLNIAVTNGTPVRFYYLILWTADAITTGAKFALNGPAGNLIYRLSFNTSSTIINDSGPIRAYDTASATGTGSEATSNIALIDGILVPTASGTLALRSGAEVAGPGAVTVKAGSSVRYW